MKPGFQYKDWYESRDVKSIEQAREACHALDAAESALRQAQDRENAADVAAAKERISDIVFDSRIAAQAIGDELEADGGSDPTVTVDEHMRELMDIYSRLAQGLRYEFTASYPDRVVGIDGGTTLVFAFGGGAAIKVTSNPRVRSGEDAKKAFYGYAGPDEAKVLVQEKIDAKVRALQKEVESVRKLEGLIAGA